MEKETNNTYLHGALRILNGRYKDAIIHLQPNEELVIGRDVNQCHFILEAPWVSRLHCMVAYEDEKKQYIITDYSENGTFVKGGVPLSKGKPQYFSSGTVIEIGEGRIQIQML